MSDNLKAWIHWQKKNPTSEDSLQMAKDIEDAIRQARLDALEEAATVHIRMPLNKEDEEMYYLGASAVIVAIRKLKGDV